MPDLFLYETLDAVTSMDMLNIDIPGSVSQNLNQKYSLRPYQIEAFSRFIYCFQKDFPEKTYPLHFMFNMATGSGKTLIMAGLILYLYELGYRNFLFFVSYTNIIQKTIDNFLNPDSIKYLFNEAIHIKNKQVRITPVENFESVNPNDINICFTTIQKLHSDLTAEKENSITYEDFHKHRIVLIGDEAHHMSVQTKAQQEMFESWENSIERIFRQNNKNILLEFTATHDYESAGMVEKYRNKVVFRYDLIQFRNDRYSKDVIIVQTNLNLSERILQALILSQYKQEVAAKHHIDLKPVILLKAQRTIAQSLENKSNFHDLIEKLTAQDIKSIRKKSNLDLVSNALDFFENQDISDVQLTKRLKHEFQESHCLSVNDENEKETYQVLVNTLEDKSNRIRVIFTVKKLTEGWDVLNLFDIVRCYETRDSGGGKIGQTTISEAQLIGRGARYYPFSLPDNNEHYRRKFDGNLTHELRIIEELHYHSINKPRYITELKKALKEQGIYDDTEITRELKLKDNFKNTDFYKYGVIWLNKRLSKDYKEIQSLNDLGVKKKNFLHTITSGHGRTTIALGENSNNTDNEDILMIDRKISDFEESIVRSAIARNRFYNFNNIKKYFPNLSSISQFIESKEYLGGIEITIKGSLNHADITHYEKLISMCGLLTQIESEIKQQITNYQGTRDFTRNWVREIFHDKLLKFSPDNPRVSIDNEFDNFISSKEWFAFNTIFGTSEEKAFIEMLSRQISNLHERFRDIYVLRNEGHFSIYNYDDGQAFQPGFVLFLRENNGEMQIFQMFVEPKGKHLQEHDRWKERFLQEITNQYIDDRLVFEGEKYRLIGVPFYNNEDENEFREIMELALSIP